MPALSPTMSQGNIANWQVRMRTSPWCPHAQINFEADDTGLTWGLSRSCVPSIVAAEPQNSIHHVTWYQIRCNSCRATGCHRKEF